MTSAYYNAIHNTHVTYSQYLANLSDVLPNSQARDPEPYLGGLPKAEYPWLLTAASDGRQVPVAANGSYALSPGALPEPRVPLAIRGLALCSQTIIRDAGAPTRVGVHHRSAAHAPGMSGDPRSLRTDFPPEPCHLSATEGWLFNLSRL